MPVLKALKKFRYDRVKLRPGDLFKCRDKHVPLVTRAQLAALPEVQEAEPKQLYKTRHMEAETPRIVEHDKLEAEKPLGAMTVAELRAEAGIRGIHLPSGYIAKAELLSIVSEG